MATPGDTAYTVTEAAERTGFTVHTLRYYEQEGLLPLVRRDRTSRHRRYTDNDLRLLHFLKRMRETGMTITQMKTYVALLYAGDHTIEVRVELLKAHREAARGQIARMQEHLSALDSKIDNYQALSREYSQEKANAGESNER